MNPLAASMLPKPQLPAQAAPVAPASAPVSPLMQKNALLSSVGAAINGFQRGFDPAGWQAGQDKAKADQAEALKQKVAMLEQVRTLPMDQRLKLLPQLSSALGQQIPESIMSDQEIDGQLAIWRGQMGVSPEQQTYDFQSIGGGGLVRTNPNGTYETVIQPSEKDAKGPEIRQVGNAIVERQADGSWKPVYTGTNAEETARAFQGFIDAATGEQMVVMSNGQARSTGHKAYVAPQMTSVGGVPTAIDKRTYEATQIAPLADVAGNKAAIASAEVQGKAQGTAAFNLPAVEQRSQNAINSIADLKRRNIGARFGLQSKLYAIPGSEGADVQSLVRQVTSQAFLNAFDQLRGAGAITETEGKAATAAVTRLQDQNISVEEALKSMDELSAYYQKGVQIARQLAVKAPVLPERPVSNAGVPASMVPPLPAPPPQQGFYASQAAKFKSAATPKPSSSLTPDEQAELEALKAELGLQ